jgi:cysteine synthase
MTTEAGMSQGSNKKARGVALAKHENRIATGEALVNISIVDRVIAVGSQEVVDMTKRLLREEGLVVEVSSGANVLAALKVAGELEDWQTIVTILPDRGEDT